MAHFFSSHWSCVDVESQVQLLKHFYFLELERRSEKGGRGGPLIGIMSGSHEPL